MSPKLHIISFSSSTDLKVVDENILYPFDVPNINPKHSKYILKNEFLILKDYQT